MFLRKRHHRLKALDSLVKWCFLQKAPQTGEKIENVGYELKGGRNEVSRYMKDNDWCNYFEPKCFVNLSFCHYWTYKSPQYLQKNQSFLSEWYHCVVVLSVSEKVNETRCFRTHVFQTPSQVQQFEVNRGYLFRT